MCHKLVTHIYDKTKGSINTLLESVRKVYCSDPKEESDDIRDSKGKKEDVLDWDQTRGRFR